MALMEDALGRPLRSLRLSVTDRCNLRCQYCMPEQEYVWLRREDLLSFEEIAELASIFTDLGVTKMRLTGGEPLLRRDLPTLVGLLARNDRIRDLAMTTNGILLGQYAQDLRKAGLQRVTVSLDTLKPERFRAFVRRDLHGQVQQGIFAACDAGFTQVKINSVVIRGFNDDELADLVAFGRNVGAEVRFIEYMDVGGATRWSSDQVVSRDELLQILEHHFGRILPLEEDGASPASRYRLPDGATFGIISSTTRPFCRACDRSRLTADGMWFHCLYSQDGVDLKRLLRGGGGREEITGRIARAWQARTDRGAEERLAIASRGVLFRADDLRRDPHREMHTRGG